MGRRLQVGGDLATGWGPGGRFRGKTAHPAVPCPPLLASAVPLPAASPVSLILPGREVALEKVELPPDPHDQSLALRKSFSR